MKIVKKIYLEEIANNSIYKPRNLKQVQNIKQNYHEKEQKLGNSNLTDDQQIIPILNTGT